MRTKFGEQLRYQEIVAVGPGSLPVHRNDVKLHVRLGMDVSGEDAKLDAFIRDAARSVEVDCGRALVMQTRKLYLDQWPLRSSNQPADYWEDVEIRGCPLWAVDSVTYTDYNGATQTWASSGYQVNAADEPARLRYVWGSLWPVARQQEKSICITYHCGYVTPFTVDPATDILTLKGDSPTNGDTFRISNSGGLIPGGLATETDYYVVNATGSTCKLSLTAGGSAIDITSAGTGLQFLGELDPRAMQAICFKVALNYVDREGAEYKSCSDGYWSRIYSLRYEGV